MLQALASGAAWRGECGAGPWEDLALQGSVLLSEAWPPSLSSSYNLLFSDTSAPEVAISWPPCVSPAPPGPLAQVSAAQRWDLLQRWGAGWIRVVAEHPEGEGAGDGCVLTHVRASTWLCSSVFLLHSGAHPAPDSAFGYPVSAYPRLHLRGCSFGCTSVTVC